jgi:uncharacterized protein (UPF0128 family)
MAFHTFNMDAPHFKAEFEIKVFAWFGAGATALVGLLGYTHTTFRSFWAVPVLALYPLSIFAVWGLDTLGFKWWRRAD